MVRWHYYDMSIVSLVNENYLQNNKKLIFLIKSQISADYYVFHQVFWFLILPFFISPCHRGTEASFSLAHLLYSLSLLAFYLENYVYSIFHVIWSFFYQLCRVNFGIIVMRFDFTVLLYLAFVVRLLCIHSLDEFTCIQHRKIALIWFYCSC